jgi:hypothetical protein
MVLLVMYTVPNINEHYHIISQGNIPKLLPQQLLAAIIEEPNFVQLVREVFPAILSKLINHIGLEGSGEIVEMATIEQLRHIFDEDLWKTGQSGSEETFDANIIKKSHSQRTIAGTW